MAQVRAMAERYASLESVHGEVLAEKQELSLRLSRESQKMRKLRERLQSVDRLSRLSGGTKPSYAPAVAAADAAAKRARGEIDTSRLDAMLSGAPAAQSAAVDADGAQAEADAETDGVDASLKQLEELELQNAELRAALTEAGRPLAAVDEHGVVAVDAAVDAPAASPGPDEPTSNWTEASAEMAGRVATHAPDGWLAMGSEVGGLRGDGAAGEAAPFDPESLPPAAAIDDLDGAWAHGAAAGLEGEDGIPHVLPEPEPFPEDFGYGFGDGARYVSSFRDTYLRSGVQSSGYGYSGGYGYAGVYGYSGGHGHGGYGGGGGQGGGPHTDMPPGQPPPPLYEGREGQRLESGSRAERFDIIADRPRSVAEAERPRSAAGRLARGNPWRHAPRNGPGSRGLSASFGTIMPPEVTEGLAITGGAFHDSGSDYPRLEATYPPHGGQALWPPSGGGADGRGFVLKDLLLHKARESRDAWSKDAAQGLPPPKPPRAVGGRHTALRYSLQ